MSNDITTAERAIQVLHDRLHVATKKVYDIAARQQSLGYAVYVENDPRAHAELSKLNAENDAANAEVSNIKAAIAEANKRLTAAQQATAHAEALVHINRINELLATVQELAPKLDVCWGALVRGSAGGFRREVGLKDPPLLDKVGNLVVEITRELKALGGLDCGTWLPGRFEQMHIDDFRIALEKLAQAYQHGPPVRARNFVELISSWSASVKAALAQHEQTDNAGRVAA